MGLATELTGSALAPRCLPQSETLLPRRILVLGCAGFIGSHLLDRLLSEAGVVVTGVDRADTKIQHLLGHPALRMRRASLEELGSEIDELVAANDAVVHLAALCNPSLYNRAPVEVINDNFVQSARLPELCARRGRPLVYFSTSEVYGRTTSDDASQPLREDVTPLVLGPIRAQRWTYACAKQLMERWIAAHGHETGLTFTILRPFNFLGPRMDYLPGYDGEGTPRVLACFVEALLRGRPLRLVDGGQQQRTFTDIRDAVDATIAVLQQPDAAANRIFNVGNPANEIRISDLAHRLAAVYAGLNPTAPPARFETVTGEAFYGPGYEDSARRVPDITLARTLLGWEPRHSLDETLRWTLGWFVEHYGSPRA